MLFTMLLALAPNAFADECDARALQKEAVAAAPVKAAPAFVALANCDKAKAKAVAPKVLPNMLSGSEGNQASVSAIEVGASADLRTWLNGLEPDQSGGFTGRFNLEIADENQPHSRGVRNLPGDTLSHGAETYQTHSDRVIGYFPQLLQHHNKIFGKVLLAG